MRCPRDKVRGGDEVRDKVRRRRRGAWGMGNAKQCETGGMRNGVPRPWISLRRGGDEVPRPWISPPSPKPPDLAAKALFRSPQALQERP